MIDSEIWFEVLKTPKDLSAEEKMWLRTGYESQFVGQITNAMSLKTNLEYYFEMKYGVTRSQLDGRSKIKEINEPRQMIIHCLIRYSGLSKSETARHYNRDHATAIYSEKRIDNLLETEKLFRMKYVDMLNWVGLGTAATRLIKKYN